MERLEYSKVYLLSFIALKSIAFKFISIYIVQFSRCIHTSALAELHYERLNGGDEEDRTLDPLRARQVLSQLSYAPTLSNRNPKDLVDDIHVIK